MRSCLVVLQIYFIGMHSNILSTSSVCSDETASQPNMRQYNNLIYWLMYPLARVCLFVCLFVFNVPPTAKVIWRRATT